MIRTLLYLAAASYGFFVIVSGVWFWRLVEAAPWMDEDGYFNYKTDWNAVYDTIDEWKEQSRGPA